MAVKGGRGETWAWWGWWLDQQKAPDGEPRDGVREVAEGMAREILARIPLPEERAAVLDLICYRALLRLIPKLRGLGVVGQEEFRRRLGLAEAPSRKALKWLISLGLARAPTSGPYEIPEAVVETCLRLKETRGPKWWKEVAPAPHKPYKPYGPMSAEHKANLREALRRSWDVRRAQTKTST